MQKLKEYWQVIVFAFIVTSAIFYWYQLRPAKIYKECAKYAREEIGLDSGFSQYSPPLYDMQFKWCLNDKGIEK